MGNIAKTKRQARLEKDADAMLEVGSSLQVQHSMLGRPAHRFDYEIFTKEKPGKHPHEPRSTRAVSRVCIA